VAKLADLSGMVLMAMKILPFNDELIVNLAADDDFRTFHIVKYPEVSHPQLEASQGVRSHALDCTARRDGLF
jgi:hypothetical protein